MAPFGQETLSATDKFIEIVEGLGGNAAVASTNGSLFAAFPGADGKPLYPFNLWRQKAGGQLSLSLNYLAPRQAFADESVRQRLYDRAVEIFGPLSTQNLNGFPVTTVLKLNDPAVAKGFRTLLEDILELGGK
jgi:hypothetical protein